MHVYVATIGNQDGYCGVLTPFRRNDGRMSGLYLYECRPSDIFAIVNGGLEHCCRDLISYQVRVFVYFALDLQVGHLIVSVFNFGRLLLYVCCSFFFVCYSILVGDCDWFARLDL